MRSPYDAGRHAPVHTAERNARALGSQRRAPERVRDKRYGTEIEISLEEVLETIQIERAIDAPANALSRDAQPHAEMARGECGIEAKRIISDSEGEEESPSGAAPTCIVLLRGSCVGVRGALAIHPCAAAAQNARRRTGRQPPRPAAPSGSVLAAVVRSRWYQTPPPQPHQCGRRRHTWQAGCALGGKPYGARVTWGQARCREAGIRTV